MAIYKVGYAICDIAGRNVCLQPPSVLLLHDVDHLLTGPFTNKIVLPPLTILIQRVLHGDRIIVHIRRHLGNLKKTYLSCQCPMFEVPMFDRANQTLARFQTSTLFTHWQPMFEWALPMKMYDYTFPFVRWVPKCKTLKL